MVEDNFMQTEWNQSYNRGGNMVFYPHEEIVRFVNRYVRKRSDFAEFHDIMKFPQKIASLDLGCGIGRHVRFLDEFRLNPYGIDLSSSAISKGRDWFRFIGKEYLAGKIKVASITEIPFEDNFFSIYVSHGVLDSMPREIAIQGMKEVKRVLTKDGLMYLDLIMATDTCEGDHIVPSGYERGTVQSYFTVESIKELLSDFKIIDFKIITLSDELGNVINKRAHIVIKNI